MADFAYQAPDQSNAYGPDAGIGPRPKAGLDRLRGAVYQPPEVTQIGRAKAPWPSDIMQPGPSYEERFDQ